MADPDWWARGIALGSATLALGSLTYTARTYRRAGARFIVSIGPTQATRGTGIATLVLGGVGVLVRNRGLAAGEVNQIRIFADLDGGARRISTITTRGAEVPGLSSRDWSKALDQLRECAGLPPDTPMKLRAEVVFGSGQRKRTRWVTVSAKDVLGG